MSSTPQITTSRRGIIASALGVCTLIALPKKSHALANREQPDHENRPLLP